MSEKAEVGREESGAVSSTTGFIKTVNFKSAPAQDAIKFVKVSTEGDVNQFEVTVDLVANPINEPAYREQMPDLLLVLLQTVCGDLKIAQSQLKSLTLRALDSVHVDFENKLPFRNLPGSPNRFLSDKATFWGATRFQLQYSMQQEADSCPSCPLLMSDIGSYSATPSAETVELSVENMRKLWGESWFNRLLDATVPLAAEVDKLEKVFCAIGLTVYMMDHVTVVAESYEEVERIVREEGWAWRVSPLSAWCLSEGSVEIMRYRLLREKGRLEEEVKEAQKKIRILADVL